MNLHNDIMNLPCKPNPDNFLDAGTLLTYKEGHRDARHAAAALAIAADARIEELESQIDTLSHQLAAERLRADTGWARYENANMGQKLAREELARLNAKLAEKEVVELDYEAVAQKAGYRLAVNGKSQYFWYNDAESNNIPYIYVNNCWKACCEDNGLLGENL